MEPLLKLRVGQKIDTEEVMQALFRFNYEQSEYVSRPGEFAVRGNLIDAFPFNYRLPLRIEFGIDVIQSIRDFTLYEHDTLAEYEECTLIPLHEFFEKKMARRQEQFIDYEPLTSFFRVKQRKTLFQFLKEF